MKKKIIVVGSNHAGTSCSNKLLTNPNNEVTIIDKTKDISFLGCGLALWVGDQISKPDGLFYQTKQGFEENGATVKLETEVTKIDFDKKIVFCKNKKNEKSQLEYDKLVLATGANPVCPPFEGLDLQNINLVQRFHQAKEIHKKLSDPEIKNVTVVGAGYIGVELAEAFRRKDKQVRLLDLQTRVLPTHFDPEFSKKMEEVLTENGIVLNLGEKVLSFKGDKKVKSIVTDKGSYETDLVVLCIGFKPESSLGDRKLEKFKNGAYLVNRRQETSIKDVYAIGDCATVYDNSLEKTNYIALATNAVRSGIIAASNINGEDLESPGVQGSSALSIYGLKMVSTGLSVESAKKFGIPVEYTEFTAPQKPKFMDEAGPNPEVTIRIVYHKENRRVLGAQLVSYYDMSATIHMFSLAIQEKVTIKKLALLDIFFMPHFNEPYNYITVAALNSK